MRWARRILIAISVVVVLIGATIVLLLSIDLSRFKSNLEVYVSEATARDFVIAGQFNPSIGKTIDLVAGDVRLANADWGVARNILELERVVVSIDTWSLLSGPIEVLNLEVEGLTLYVEKDPDTLQSSWSFGEAAAETDSADDERQPFELPLWLEKAHLQRVKVTYGQGWLDAPRNISISDARLSADEHDLLKMVLAGAIEDEAIRAEGLVGPLSALLDGRGPRWEVQVTIGDFLASTQGTFDDLFTLDGPKIQAVMQGPLAERILARFGLPPLAHGPVDITGDLAEGPDGIDLRVEGAFGDLATEVVGRAQSFGTIRNLDLSVNIRGPNLQAIGELFDAGFLPSAEFAVIGGVTGKGDTLNLDSIVVSVGDARLEMDGTLTPTEVDPDAQLQLSASGTEIRDFLPEAFAERIPFGAFDVQAIAVGGLHKPELRELIAKLGEHELTIQGHVPATANMNGLDIELTAAGPDFDQIVGPWAERDISTEPYLLTTRIHNSGDGFVVEDLRFEVANAKVALTGSSGTLPTFKGLNASITISGENLQATMEPWLEVALPAIPFGLDGKFIESDGALTLSNVVYQLGDARGSLDGTSGMLPSLNGLRMNNSLAGPDASQFAAALGGPEDSALLPAVAFETHGVFSKTSDGWFAKPWSLRIGESRLELNGAFGNLDGAAGIDIDVVASGPDLRRFLPDRGIQSPLAYEVEGGVRIGDTAIELKKVNLRVGETSAWFDGRLPSGAALTNAEFDVRIAGPNLKLIGQTFNIQGLAPEAFRVEGALTRAGDAYSVNNLIAVVGENDLAGNMRVEIGTKTRLTGRLESDHLNLTDLIDQDDTISERDDDVSESDRVIPDTALPLQVLDVADIDLILRLRRLRSKNFDVGDVELKLVIENDELHVDTGRVSLKNGGTLTAVLDVVRSGDDQADVRANIVGEQFRLRPPIDGDGNPINRPPEDLKLVLSGSGRTIRDLAASANGSISLRQGEGDIENDFNGYLMRDMVSEIFRAMNPLATKSDYTHLNCGFFEIDIVGGVAKSRALGLQTDKLAVASVGTVNLATEVLDLSFRVKQREGVGISLAGIVNPYIKVGGTLASPALTIDKKRGFLSGTVAVFTGGLSILAQGVWDRYLSRDDYCQAVIDALESGEIPVWDGPATEP